eukprot:m.119145 g.119145  ORF g.119145 m.119145 type:complete len:650 (+) comp21773_c2_seq1:133-2082(+)
MMNGSAGILDLGEMDVVGMAMDEADSPLNIPESIDAARETLTTRLVGRPTQQELVARNIMPGGSSHPKLHAASVSLSWDMREATLNRKLSHRPTKDEVVQRNIMKAAQSSALVLERRHEIEQNQKRRFLESRLENRPGPLDLVCSGYIEPPGNLDVSSCVKREWSGGNRGGDSAAVKHEPSEGILPPLPPPLPELSPSRRGSVTFDFDPLTSDPVLSPSPHGQPSLYSIMSDDMGWGDRVVDGAGAAEIAPATTPDFSFDFMLSGMGMDLEGLDGLTGGEHGHIMQEQLKHQVDQVNPCDPITGFSSAHDSVVEDVHDTFRKKADMHQQLTTVQRRATLPMRSIRPRVQRSNAEEHGSTMQQAAAGVAETSGGGGGGGVGGGSGPQMGWANQLAHLESAQRQPKSGVGGTRTTTATQSTTARKKNKKIKKFTYHNYTGPVDKKKNKRKANSRVTPPSPNRQIVLHQQEQFLHLEEIAERKSSLERGDLDSVAAAAFEADMPTGNSVSRTPPDLDFYNSTPTSLQHTFDDMNPAAIAGAPQPYTMGSGDAAVDGVVRRIPSPATVGLLRGHQRAGSWGGRLEPPHHDVSSHRSSTPLTDVHFDDVSPHRDYDSGFGHDVLASLGMLPGHAITGDTTMMEDMGIGIDYDLH